MKKLLNLFLTFLKIGLFTFGGGYAMISLIESECSNNKNWITSDEMRELIVLSESTPGPIAINAATFVGYKANKTIGSIVATIGVTMPSLIIITLISIFLNNLENNLFIDFIFQAIRASVIFLMSYAFINIFKKTSKNALFYTLIIFTFILNFIFNVKSIYIIIFSIILSIVMTLVQKEKKEEK